MHLFDNLSNAWLRAIVSIETISQELQRSFADIRRSQARPERHLVGLLGSGGFEECARIVEGLFEMRVVSKYICSVEERAREFLAAETASAGRGFFHTAVKSLAEERSRREAGEGVDAEKFYLMSSYRFTRALRFGCPPITSVIGKEEQTLTKEQLDSIAGLLLYIASVSALSIGRVFLELSDSQGGFLEEERRGKERELMRLSEELTTKVGGIPFRARPTESSLDISAGKFESVGFARRTDAFFSNQLRLMSALADEIAEEERRDVVAPLLITGARSGRAIVSLCREGFGQDALIVARGFFERLLNACYLAVADEQVVTSYRNHGLQKAFRTRNREVEAGDVKVALQSSVDIDPSDIPGLEEALDEFTSKHGREKTRWTSTRAEDRIALIQERTEVDTGILVLALLSIYEDASEAIHGTLYGSIFDLLHISGGVKNAGPKDVKEHSRTHITTSMILCGLSVGVLAEVYAERFSVDDSLIGGFKEVRQRFAEDLKRVMDIP